MADELDERSPHELADTAPRCQDIGDREDGRDEADCYSQQDFEDKMAAPEAKQTLVPERGQQLLTVSVGHKLHTTQQQRHVQHTTTTTTTHGTAVQLLCLLCIPSQYSL